MALRTKIILLPLAAFLLQAALSIAVIGVDDDEPAPVAALAMPG